MEKQLIIILVALFSVNLSFSQGLIVDHKCTDIAKIPVEWINTAKTTLHIAYGHTSHGSQIIDGMSGLVSFTGGKGGPQFGWNNGGKNGALDLYDRAMDGDCGYYPQWVDNTRSFLDNPENSKTNVIIWSWCGQISNYNSTDLIYKYINPMVQLEKDYPKVRFVYMTGHLNYDQYDNTTARNKQLRDFCIANNKALFDFVDLECYDPDGVFYKYANDNCDYFDALASSPLGNWAQNWQNSHQEGVDWYNCNSAHSQSLNANQKAYAAWYLWASLAGWQQTTGQKELEQISTLTIFPNPSNGKIAIELSQGNIVSIKLYNASGIRVFSSFESGIVQKKEVDISGLAKGVYLVKVNNGEKYFTEKIMKL